VPRPGLRLAEPYVVVHPGASVPARAWDPGRWTELVAGLATTGRRVAVTGGPDERHLTARVAAGLPGVLDLGGETTLAELAEVIAHAGAIAVGNTGPAHLAAAVGTPVVSLFAPTVPAARWRPWRVPHELHSVPVACAGCRARACPVPGHPCLDDVAVDAVLASVERLAATPEAVAA
jgi:ADP-heptose:LPS heptosyltransferase